MTDTLKLKFEFEELSISICGRTYPVAMFDGEAMLSGDEDGFNVVFLDLGHGVYLRPRGNGPLGFSAPFEDELFARISAVIENRKTEIGRSAHSAWVDLVEDSTSAASKAAYASDVERAQA